MGAIEVAVIIIGFLVFALLMLGLTHDRKISALEEGDDDDDDAKSPVNVKRSAISTRWLVVLIAYTAGVVIFAGITHINPDARFCETTTTTTEPSESIQEVDTEVQEGSFTGEPEPLIDNTQTTTTKTPASTSEVETCKGMSATQVVILLLPGLLLLVPFVRSLDIAGVFSVAFREVEDKIEEQTKKTEEQTAKIGELTNVVTSIKNEQKTIVQVFTAARALENEGRRVTSELREASDSEDRKTFDPSEYTG